MTNHGIRLANGSLLEIEVFERKMDFDNAGGLDSRSQNILFGWLVILGSQSVQIVQKAVRCHKGQERRSI